MNVRLLYIKNKKLKIILILVLIIICSAIVFVLQFGNNRILHSTSKPGDVVIFGSYEQDGNADNLQEELEWIVLEVQEDQALLISRYALEAKPYNIEESISITWEDCSLRYWLNNDFLNEAFSSEEQSKIVQAELVNGDNMEYGTAGGCNTEDYIFCLSLDEADQYFDSNLERFCCSTEYAMKQGVRAFSSSGSCIWWLRSPGMGNATAAYVSSDGSVCSFGNYVGDEAVAVRPALWVRICN